MSTHKHNVRREHITCYDTPAQIAMCERCRKPDCDNCISSNMQFGRHAAKWVQFRALYDLGLTDAEIAAAMGLTAPTISAGREWSAVWGR